MNKKVLILKDNYNTFEQFYNNEFCKIGIKCEFYYKSSSCIRKLVTHYGLIYEPFWYGKWKEKLQDFDTIIVFDSIHTSKLLKYLFKNSYARLIYWHWNPLNSNKSIKIYEETKYICEHWTFNPIDAEKFHMRMNNQFFFYQDLINVDKENNAFFVGTDKGRYDFLLRISEIILKCGYNPDFHVIDKKKEGSYIQKSYMQYTQVLNSIRKSNLIVEIVQDGQNGLTIRSLEAMFFNSKLLTNNKDIINYPFYNKNNIFIIGVDNMDRFGEFLNNPFLKIEQDALYQFSAQGWIENFG